MPRELFAPLRHIVSNQVLSEESPQSKTMELAQLYVSSGQYSLAEEKYRELITELSPSDDNQSSLVLDCQDQLSLMLHNRGKYEEAESLNRQVLLARS